MNGPRRAGEQIGFLIDPDQPMVWRGPMVTQALEQLLTQTNWQRPRLPDRRHAARHRRHPPDAGAEDPVTGAVIVTTPQDIALLDAQKGCRCSRRSGVPILGIVENMAIHVLQQCGHAEHMFGEGGGARMAAEYGVESLGALPLDIRIREQADGGRPRSWPIPTARSRASTSASRGGWRCGSPRWPRTCR
jgi:ATP-binding protein involved in chromosome partitioning